MYTLTPSHHHLWSHRCVLGFPLLCLCLPAWTGSLSHLGLPRPISSQNRCESTFLWTLPRFSLSWHLIGLCITSLGICISLSLSSFLGDRAGILALYSQCLAQPLTHNAYRDERIRSTYYMGQGITHINEKINKNLKKSDVNLVKAFVHFDFFPSMS